jgi:hypothetical protein
MSIHHEDMTLVFILSEAKDLLFAGIAEMQANSRFLAPLGMTTPVIFPLRVCPRYPDPCLTITLPSSFLPASGAAFR